MVFLKDTAIVEKCIAESKTILSGINSSASTDEQEDATLVKSILFDITCFTSVELGCLCQRMKARMQGDLGNFKRLKTNHTYLIDMSILLPDSPAARTAFKLETEWEEVTRNVKVVEKR